MRVLVFDTETTGLIPKKNSIQTNTDNNTEWYKNYPYVVQLSWLIFDTSDNTIEQIQDLIIKLPDGATIPEESSKIHKITNEIMMEEGIPIKEALELFIESLYNINKIVAHNIEFDSKMLHAEFARNSMMNYISLTKKKQYCTMKNTIDFCKLERTSKYSGKKYFKYPQLNELHERLFGNKLQNLHNALYDIIICLRCYMKYVHDVDILCKNDFINDIYKSLI
jgi:DNA polymerase-3 subunit epsilon